MALAELSPLSYYYRDPKGKARNGRAVPFAIAEIKVSKYLESIRRVEMQVAQGSRMNGGYPCGKPFGGCFFLPAESVFSLCVCMFVESAGVRRYGPSAKFVTGFRIPSRDAHGCT